MLKVGIFTNCYKDNISNKDVSLAISAGIKKGLGNDVDITSFPIGDGGLGTSETIAKIHKLKKYHLKKKGPLMKPIDTFVFYNEKTKIGAFDMAQISGLHLVPTHKRNPLKTTTYGVGELIMFLVLKGAQKIYIGLGDSATNDGGIGMAQAIGYCFYDKNDNKIEKGRFPLSRIYRIEANNVPKVEIIGLCDGTIKMLGKKNVITDASKQKGATKKHINILNKEFLHLNKIVSKHFNVDLADIEKGGVAGGLGGGLVVFLGATLINGTQYISQKMNFNKVINNKDFIIVAEGEVSFQTSEGKSPSVIGKIAKKLKKPVILFCAKYGSGYNNVFSDGIKMIINTDDMLFNFKTVKEKQIAKRQLAQKSFELASIIKTML